MPADKIFIPAIVATTTMTLFSYLASQKEKRNFSEPELLASFEKKQLPRNVKQVALPAGWITHYSVGVLMTILFNIISKPSKSVLQRSAITGGTGGLFAMAAWEV